MRYFVDLAYNGTNYHGWQVQPNAPSVQETINKAINTLTRQEVKLVGCGRTDTGVHARDFVAHFDSTAELDTEKLVYKLNRFLPSDIVIYKMYKVNDEANSRFDALSRTYEYHITLQKNPFETEQCYYYTYGSLDVEAMNQAAQKLFNYIDFTSFSKLHTDVKTNNCKIMYVQWSVKNSKLIFTIKADRFLRNMVRAIVGTLLEVGKGKMSVDQFCDVIEQKDRGKAGVSAPAQGLFLTKIEYPDKIFAGDC